MPGFSISAHSHDFKSFKSLGPHQQPNAVRKRSSFRQTPLKIDQQAVLLNFEILLKLLFALLHNLICLARFLIFCLQKLDVLLDLTDHLDQPAVSFVVAVFNLRPSDPFLQTSLGNFQRRVLSHDRSLDFVHTPFHVGQFLKREFRKKRKKCWKKVFSSGNL